MVATVTECAVGSCPVVTVASGSPGIAVEFEGSPAERGLARFRRGDDPVGAGFVVDGIYVVTCAHVVNTSVGRPAAAAEPPRACGPVDVRVDGRWVEVEVALDRWVPATSERRGDVAVFRLMVPLPKRAQSLTLHWLSRHRECRFIVQGFLGGKLAGASGHIRSGITVGEEWVEDDRRKA